MAGKSEALKQAQSRYKKQSVINVSVGFNKNTEPELFEYMDSYEGNRPALLRESLREHIAREKAE